MNSRSSYVNPVYRYCVWNPRAKCTSLSIFSLRVSISRDYVVSFMYCKCCGRDESYSSASPCSWWSDIHETPYYFSRITWTSTKKLWPHCVIEVFSLQSNLHCGQLLSWRPLKKDGITPRICGDYWLTLNEPLYQHCCITDGPEDIFNRLYGSKCFSKMDLKDANLQIPLDPESSSLTTITTPFGVIPVQLSSSRSHCFTGYIPECYQFNRHRCWWCRGVPRWHNRSWSGKVFTWCQTTFTLWEVLSVQCACQSW